MDIAEIDEKGKGLLFFGDTLVEKCQLVEGQPNVYLLQTSTVLERKTQVSPKAGQFYLIKSKKSNVNYNRPISVYHSEERINEEGKKEVTVQFMILEKGQGTQELCHMNVGDKMVVIGPLGTPWPQASEEEMGKICIVGGGIGVAPVANFASSLPAKSYDFYASFKSGSYGLDYVDAANLKITTDDGSVGIHGMLPAALSKEAVEKAGYKVIYACGPGPALAYVKNLAEELGIKCWISMEHRMLCGLGACLGCTIETKEGLKRCCKDGPVFDARILDFPKPPARRKPLEKDEEPDISVEIANIKFKNPTIASAGTFSYGQNFRGVSDVAAWGGIASKGVTFEPRVGNKGERCLEVAGGNMNSIGLQNPGIPYFVENLLPGMIGLGPVVIANLAGSDIESYVEGAKLLDKTDCDMIELNISCPNVKAAGLAWGLSAETAYYCVSSVRAVTKKPLMVKLSPNAPDNRPIALACIKAGADAISLINMVHGVAIDIEKGKPFFNNVHAGYSGPGLKPLALRIVYDVIEEINKLPPEERVPVVGIGGITNWKDAVEFIMAGCTAIEIGQAKFTNPNVAIDVVEGLKAFMKSHGYKNLAQMRGIAQIKHVNEMGSGDERAHYKELKDMVLSYLPVLPNVTKK
ncbi:MAG: dihydroorotate dehydrogenase [Treponemataceae bacterium]|nr:dihydroorotate dehydrogenase [Treponemataceae bacterium]